MSARRFLTQVRGVDQHGAVHHQDRVQTHSAEDTVHIPRPFLMFTLLFVLSATTAQSQTADPSSKVLIRSAKPYAALETRISSLGGRVVYEYKYVDAIAAELPTGALNALRGAVDTAAITKDVEFTRPGNIDTLRGRNLTGGISNEFTADGVEPLSEADVQRIAAVNPNAYLLGNSVANVSSLHAAGITGAGVVVALIDTGIRPGFPHISVDGSVIGCEDFVHDSLGSTNSGNNYHGTFVAGMISANTTFVFGTTNPLRNAVLAECPACFSNPPTNTAIPMVGTAPSSSIYALRVFGPSGGASESRILAAMERSIELREKFDAGLPDGSNIQVVNMSLGGLTQFPGRELLDVEADVMLEKGIVPVIAAGNAGPSAITVGSPAASSGAIAVGAASLAHNERIWARLQLGPVNGSFYRPFLGAQTAYFSSRGPNADGRIDPDVLSNGVACFGQGVSFPINIPSGISNAEFRLSWREGWDNVPGNDIDLLIVTPGGSFNFAGATLNSPEQVAINNPVAGTWVVIVSAFKVPTETDKFELRVSLDGKVVK